MVGRLGLLDIIASAEDVDQDGPPDVIPAAVDLHAPPEFVEVASRDDLLAIIAAAEDDVVAEDGPPDVVRLGANTVHMPQSLPIIIH